MGPFFNCGQICIAVKRLYLFETIADEFIAKLKDRVERLAQRMGNGLDPETRLGPLHTENQREEIKSMVVDAINRGAQIPFGGVKQSGVGREHGYEALEYYLETKGVVVGT